MALATAGAIAIGNFEEAAMLIVIFAGAHFLEEYVDGKSKREITNLLNMNPTEARILYPDGTTKVVPVDQVKVGDTLQVLNGAQVPTDGVVLSGTTAIDESSINGESIPKEKQLVMKYLAVRLMELVPSPWKSRKIVQKQSFQKSCKWSTNHKKFNENSDLDSTLGTKICHDCFSVIPISITSWPIYLWLVLGVKPL